MNLLQELKHLLSPIVDVETGLLSSATKDKYAVLIPLSDKFENFADDEPLSELQSVSIIIFAKGNYTKIKNEISFLLLSADGINVTDRRYIGYDSEYHSYSIDVEKSYLIEG